MSQTKPNLQIASWVAVGKIKRPPAEYSVILALHQDLLSAKWKPHNEEGEWGSAKFFIEEPLRDAVLNYFNCNNSVPMDNGQLVGKADLKKYHIVASQKYYPIVLRVLRSLPSKLQVVPRNLGWFCVNVNKLEDDSSMPRDTTHFEESSTPCVANHGGDSQWSPAAMVIERWQWCSCQ